MRSTPGNPYRSALLGVALTCATAAGATAQSRVALPAGTVVIVRTTTALQSATAKAGQAFETTVEENVGVDEFTVIPARSRIRGVVTLATPATRQQSGVIEVVFDRLTLADGSAIAIKGKLTSTDTAERRQIKADPNARVVFVGARGGIGAAIAGAGAGAGSNNILAALGGMLSEGRDVSVPAGTPLAVELEQALTLRGRGRIRGAEASTIYTAAERVSAAQNALAKLNYYRGPITGRLDDATRRALFEFQVDRRLSGTGNLDGRTASALGINLAGTVAGVTLSVEEASSVRREAQSLVGQYRSGLAASNIGQLNATRAYSQGELDLWFALSAFADNASIYEQVVRGGTNRDAAVLAGRSLVAAARRVETASQNVRTSAQLQSAWTALRQRLSTIDTAPPG
jgi:hypothetical protein